MLSVSLGPLALPLAPLLLALALWAAGALARRLGGAGHGRAAESAVWGAALAGLLAARLAHLGLHADAYAASPWAVFDVRDGGWHAAAGFATGAAWLGWRAWRQRPLARALGAGALCGTVLWVAGTAALEHRAGPRTQVAPAVPLVELASGRQAALPEVLGGRPAVVNLWASWCGPCRAEMPVLAAAQQRERDVRIVFVNQGESAAAVHAYLERERLPLREVWLDELGAVGPASGSRGLPTTLFFDAAGRRVDAHFGVLNAAALEVRLQRLRRP